MKIKNYIFLSPLIFISLSCKGLYIFKSNDDISEDCIDKTKINDQVACIEISDPVCGCNKETYSNDCYAEKAGVTEWFEGECKWKKLKSSHNFVWFFVCVMIVRFSND